MGTRKLAVIFIILSSLSLESSALICRSLLNSPPVSSPALKFENTFSEQFQVPVIKIISDKKAIASNKIIGPNDLAIVFDRFHSDLFFNNHLLKTLGKVPNVKGAIIPTTNLEVADLIFVVRDISPGLKLHLNSIIEEGSFGNFFSCIRASCFLLKEHFDGVSKTFTFPYPFIKHLTELKRMGEEDIDIYLNHNFDFDDFVPHIRGCLETIYSTI